MTNRGNTTPAQGETQERTPRAPHERDESAQSQDNKEPSQDRIGGLAHDDAASGRTDTDKGPVTDQTYQREFRK
jgi:hypothetical protein